MKLTVTVIPRASCIKVKKIDNKNYKVRLTAAPTDGQANEQLIKVLAEYFSCAKSRIRIVQGRNSRKKVVEIEQ